MSCFSGPRTFCRCCKQKKLLARYKSSYTKLNNGDDYDDNEEDDDDDDNDNVDSDSDKSQWRQWCELAYQGSG